LLGAAGSAGLDLVLTDADIVSMAAGAEPAGSMLIRDERIAAVGSAERVRAAARPGALREAGLDGRPLRAGS
jgi:predicted amidohydrolase YtcJ